MKLNLNDLNNLIDEKTKIKNANLDAVFIDFVIKILIIF